MESIQSIKQRFEIIGNDVKLNRAIEKAIQVAPTDISVLVTGKAVLVRRPFQKSYTPFPIENMPNTLR